MEKRSYRVKFVKYELIDGHIEYTVKVVTNTSDEAFHIKDRYSSMRSYWRAMHSEYKNAAPSKFPPKKWFGNKKHTFVRHRMEELEHFFNVLLDEPELAMSAITQTYFYRKKDLREELKEPVKPVNQVNKEAMCEPKIVISHDKAWRKIVDDTIKSYIDISLGDDPIPPEEVKKKTLVYSNEISKTLSDLVYKSNILSLPTKVNNSLDNPNLYLIKQDLHTSEWLDKNIKIMIGVVENEESRVYRKEEYILNEFKE